MIRILVVLLSFINVQLQAQNAENLPVEIIYVENGSFTMGCIEGRDDINGLDCDDNESPNHTVTLRDFYIGKYEITQGQYQAVMGDNPSFFTACGLNCPVEQINWYAAIIFCNELTLQDTSLDASQRCYFRDAAMTEPWTLAHYNLSDGDPESGDVFFDEGGHGYRLPTEAEWAYAARGGLYSKGYQFAGSNTVEDVAWYTINALVTYSPNFNQKGTNPVGQKISNELDIFDMSGNVLEWCWDNVYDGNDLTYPATEQCNPFGTPNSLWTNGSFGHESGICCPSVRGGSWSFSASNSRISNRINDYAPNNQNFSIGFRVARYP